MIVSDLFDQIEVQGDVAIERWNEDKARLEELNKNQYREHTIKYIYAKDNILHIEIEK